MRLRRKLAAGALAAVVLTAVAACGSGSDSSGGGTKGGEKLLGIIESSGSDITTVQSAKAAKAVAEAAGWKVSIIDSQSSVDKAIAGIQALVSRKATAIMVTVYASSSLQAGINVANHAGIPVVSMAGGLAPGVGAALVSNSGAEVAAQMIKDMGGDGQSGSVLALTYHPGLPCLLRGQSFDKFMKKYPNVKITRHEIDVQSAQQDSASTTNAWLATKPKGPMAVFACYDDPAVGAVSAIKQANLEPGKVKVYGFNAQANARAEIKSGYMTASMYYDTAAAGKICFSYLEKILDEGKSWKQKQEDIPHELVDSSNLAKFESDHPDA